MGPFWEGFGVTLKVVAAGLALALLLGTLLGVFSTTRSRILRGISRVYDEFYQNTPLPVQVLFRDMAGPQFLQVMTGAAQPVRIAPFALGALGVGLYHAAYVAEVIRTGIEAVPRRRGPGPGLAAGYVAWRVLYHAFAYLARHLPRVRRVLSEHAAAGAGVVQGHGRPAVLAGHDGRGPARAHRAVRVGRSWRGPLSRGVCGRGHPHGHRGRAARVGLYHAAYVAEVIRTGIEAVPRGQMEAAQSQGFSRLQTYAYIVLPQTFKIILPPLCNQALNLVKNTSVLAAAPVQPGAQPGEEHLCAGAGGRR